MNNLNDIQKSFTAQAAQFDSNTYHLSKQEYQQYMVDKTKPLATDHVLEVAAGTCICGRAFAPYVEHVTCLDATTAMLEVGKKECEKANIHNITLVKGNAEELPFLDNSFDIVISRLAFHHFVNGEAIFAEMKRVLKPNGKLVLMDMVPGQEEYRQEIDRLEQLHDPSHVCDLTLSEMKELYTQNEMTLDLQEQIDIPVSLEGWMNLTGTPDPVKEDEIYFNHHWVLNIG